MSTKQQIESLDKTNTELGPRQEEVLKLIRSHPEGLGAWQIAAMTRRYVHAVRPRINELVARGLVEQRGERWEESTKRHEAIWVIRESGQMTFA